MTLYKSILCLNGLLPNKDFFLQRNLPIVAADGAAHALISMGLQPKVVVGDLDSVDHLLDIPKVYMPDQNYCDYQKSEQYLIQNLLLPTIVCGIAGGEIDHILNNISIFLTNTSQTSNLFYAPPLWGMVFSKSFLTLSLPINTKVSILGIPHGQIKTQGLQWDLDSQDLCFPGFNSCLNRTVNDVITLHIVEGTVLFLAHSFFSLDAIA